MLFLKFFYKFCELQVTIVIQWNCVNDEAFETTVFNYSEVSIKRDVKLECVNWVVLLNIFIRERFC